MLAVTTLFLSSRIQFAKRFSAFLGHLLAPLTDHYRLSCSAAGKTMLMPWMKANCWDILAPTFNLKPRCQRSQKQLLVWTLQNEHLVPSDIVQGNRRWLTPPEWSWFFPRVLGSLFVGFLICRWGGSVGVFSSLLLFWFLVLIFQTLLQMVEDSSMWALFSFHTLTFTYYLGTIHIA